jgi:hypothetical protein
VYFALLLGVSMLAVEGLLRAASAVSPTLSTLLAPPHRAVPSWLPDELLKERPNPEFHQHDSWGYRNPLVPERADIVVLGDSQSYGAGVAPAEAWPQQLVSRSGLTVYSVAFGGFGPVQHLLLFEQGLSLQPALVIEAFYSGNDLMDCYAAIYGRGLYPELRSTDAERVKRIALAEQNDPWLDEIDGATPDADDPTTRVPLAWSRAADLVRALARELGRRREASWSTVREEALESRGRQLVFEQGERRTILTPERRLRALDMLDPRIGEGHRLALRSIRLMRERAAEADSQFIVMMIPTKELVFSELLDEKQLREISPDYVKLLGHERRMWRSSASYFANNGIDFIDGLPALVSENAARPAYPPTPDGHPNAAGHRALATLAARAIAELGFESLHLPADDTRDGARDRATNMLFSPRVGADRIATR